jgi:hypothetical protein
LTARKLKLWAALLAIEILLKARSFQVYEKQRRGMHKVLKGGQRIHAPLYYRTVEELTGAQHVSVVNWFSNSIPLRQAERQHAGDHVLRSSSINVPLLIDGDCCVRSFVVHVLQ